MEPLAASLHTQPITGRDLAQGTHSETNQITVTDRSETPWGERERERERERAFQIKCCRAGPQRGNPFTHIMLKKKE